MATDARASLWLSGSLSKRMPPSAAITGTLSCTLAARVDAGLPERQSAQQGVCGKRQHGERGQATGSQRGGLVLLVHG